MGSSELAGKEGSPRQVPTSPHIVWGFSRVRESASTSDAVQEQIATITGTAERSVSWQT